MTDILLLDATDQLRALDARRIGAVELLDEAVRRYEATHARLNAVVVTDLDRARRRAAAIDEQRAKGEALGALAGLPMTIKDSLDVEHMPASSGLADLLQRPAEDAAVVAAARGAGAVIWGKTNVPVMTADWQSFNALYGTTNNPWNLERTCGGSSGGAAAMLAAGVTALEIGSDIGGSLRAPASFCGVFSHKPTWGLVPQTGHVPPKPGTVAARDLNVVGPMARSVRDLRLLLSVIAPESATAEAAPAALKSLKLGLWLDEPGYALDPQVRAIVEAFAARLAACGVAVEPVRPVDVAVLTPAYRTLLSAAMAEDSASAPSWSHAQWLEANEARARLGQQVSGLFDRLDGIIAPITPVTAFPHDHQPMGARKLSCSTGQTFAYTSILDWIALATACGLPATAIPAGLAADGLPVGVQIIGRRGGDSRTLAVAQAIEDELGGFRAPPPLPAS
ncbi:MAG TPA: amidase family protein [Caulobacteraceae bacterium]|jgi:amidase|nr:amidase family protein [Caulobacteraceae bacterium]